MKRLLLFCMLIGFAASGCNCKYVQPGYVGVLVDTMGSSKGQVSQVGVGRYYIGLGQSLYTFPVFKKTYVWSKNVNEGKGIDESISFQTKEGLSVNADVSITFQVDDKKVVKLFETYREGIDEITDQYLHNQVRKALNDTASQMPVESVYGAGKTEMLKQVEDEVKKDVANDGIIVEQISFTGDLRLPAVVLDRLNSKIAATQQSQQVENELRTAEAQAKKEVATAMGQAQVITATAKAQADANRILAASLTKELVEIKKVEKWDGHLPQVEGGSASAFIDMRGLGAATAEEKPAKGK